MAKKETLVNAETHNSVKDFMDSIDNEKRQEDSRKLLDVMKAVTGLEPKMWGKNIVGFGKYKYQRKDGKEFEWFKVGFSPNKAYLSLHLTYDIAKEVDLLEKLGTYKHGKGCLYIKKLEDVDMDVLKELIKKHS